MSLFSSVSFNPRKLFGAKIWRNIDLFQIYCSCIFEWGLELETLKRIGQYKVCREQLVFSKYYFKDFIRHSFLDCLKTISVKTVQRWLLSMLWVFTVDQMSIAHFGTPYHTLSRHKHKLLPRAEQWEQHMRNHGSARRHCSRWNDTQEIVSRLRYVGTNHPTIQRYHHHSHAFSQHHQFPRNGKSLVVYAGLCAPCSYPTLVAWRLMMGNGGWLSQYGTCLGACNLLPISVALTIAPNQR